MKKKPTPRKRKRTRAVKKREPLPTPAISDYEQRKRELGLDVPPARFYHEYPPHRD